MEQLVLQHLLLVATRAAPPQSPQVCDNHDTSLNILFCYELISQLLFFLCLCNNLEKHNLLAEEYNK